MARQRQRAPGVRRRASARDAVCGRLGEEAARYPELSLAPLEAAFADERESALAHALYDACVRRWITLEHVLSQVAGRPVGALEAPVRAALLCGSAQLLFFDRVPDHAAIHESVEWAKRCVRPGAGGLVNAVLRKVAAARAPRPADAPLLPRRAGWAGERDALPLSDGGAVVFTREILPEEPVARVAVAAGITPWLAGAWSGAYGRDEAARLALHALSHAPVIMNTEGAAGPLPGSLSAHEEPGNAVFTGPHEDLRRLAAERADLWVQDPGSCAAVRSARGRRPRLVVDACAGLGTKTRQLAAVFPEAGIIATDADPEHVVGLARTFEGHPRITALPQALAVKRAAGRADLVVLDVPCSNTGVLARRIEARHRAGESQLSRLLPLQARILDEALPLLAPGGAILYSTCSIDERENGAQVAAGAARLGLRAGEGLLRLPRGGPGRPGREYADGGFACVLERAAGSVA